MGGVIWAPSLGNGDSDMKKRHGWGGSAFPLANLHGRTLPGTLG